MAQTAEDRKHNRPARIVSFRKLTARWGALEPDLLALDADGVLWRRIGRTIMEFDRLPRWELFDRVSGRRSI